ncbi:MAG: small ribosomal subunit Rsm22 family protein [Candidatus Calescibacterium sp.]|nr:small ribosomal subunit Rsm22 family protein [Candidatus Calescibacterium sp.]
MENVLSYLFYFFPKTFTANYFVINQIRDLIKSKIGSEFTLYDISAGAGSATAAFLYILKKISNEAKKHKRESKPHQINLFLQDISPTFLEIAKALSEEISKKLPYKVNISTDVSDSARIQFESKPDLAISSFSVYEIFGDSKDEIKVWCHRILKSLKEDGIFILIEPASKLRNSKIIMEIRDEFKEYIISPCTHNKKCPLLNKDDWCHFGLRWNPPLYLTRAMNMIRLRVPDINFSYIILSKNKVEKDERFARIVSHRLEEKGKISFWTCEKGEKLKYHILKKNISEKNKDVEQIQMGDMVLIQDSTEKGKNEHEISSDSVLEIKGKLFDFV